MTSSDFVASLGNLLAGNDTIRNLSSVKTAVADRIREVDPGVSVSRTSYFNHTYAPDLILSWSGERVERRLFLRTTSNPDYLREDIDIVGAQHPIVFPLAGVEGESLENLVAADEPEPSALEAESRQSSTLVTDSAALDVLDRSRADRPVVGLFSRAVLQGGRGIVGQDKAQEATRVVAVGFEAAGRAESVPTREAVDAAETLLDTPRASGLTRLLQAVWLGGGAPAAAFPGPAPITAALEPAYLSFLLDAQEIDDDGFWRRVGSGLTLERLSSLPSGTRSNNLQRLIRANLDRLRAKSCRVAAFDAGKAAEAISWFILDGMVGLEARSYRAFFSTVAASEIPLPEADEPGISISDLRARAQQASIVVGEIDLGVGRRQLGYRGQGEEDVAQDSALLEIEGVLGDAVVRAATALLGGGTRQLRCNFQRLSASGRTAAKYYLTELGLTAVPMLRPLRGHEFEELRRELMRDE